MAVINDNVRLIIKIRSLILNNLLFGISTHECNAMQCIALLIIKIRSLILNNLLFGISTHECNAMQCMQLSWRGGKSWQPWKSSCNSCFEVIILLQYESFSTKIKPEGGECLRRMKWHFFLVGAQSIQCRCPTPEEAKLQYTWIFPPLSFTVGYHSVFSLSPYIHSSVTVIYLTPEFIS